MTLPYFPVLVLLLLTGCCSPATGDSSSTSPQTYIVHVHKPPSEHTGTHREWHESFLPSGPSRLVYSYGHVFSGFAARLTEEELEAVSKMPGFLHAEPNGVRTLDTTHSPSFLGLNQDTTGFWSDGAGYGKGVIIGVLDTGIAPLHPSFNDDGMPPPPRKWKGKCTSNATLCNNKLIGARSFVQGVESSFPIDDNGHGTHTASTAAGRFVANASVLGSAMGTAAGIAPYAHIAVYKVCGESGCEDADILAGIESAVADGVDVISYSVSGPAVELYNDTTATAMFGAVRKGVFVSVSAGNKGPTTGSVRNTAPWMLTVGASTMDRRVRSVVVLDNGVEFEGESAYQPENFSSSTYLPLVIPQSEEDANATFCSNRTTLESIGVKGKVVLCVAGLVGNIEKGKIVKGAGGAAMILMNRETRGYDTYSDAHVIAASHVSYADGLSILGYVNATASPMVTIVFKGTAIGGNAPAVAAFSSRGPSRVNPGILKPDVTGPGVNVLAAWHTPVGPFPDPGTPAFNMISGTSMSCPHLSGVAALLKSAHPDWSPAMIKSAIMTTTDIRTLNGSTIADQAQNDRASFYDMGAGHVNPRRASNPGLVYDIQIDDYVSYLCGLGYTDNQMMKFTHDRVTCASYEAIDEANLNYPSFAVELSASTLPSRRLQRTVTNVGEANSTYELGLVRPSGVTVSVVPETLVFSEVGEKASFTVTFGLNSTETPPFASRFSGGYLRWVSTDSNIIVRSPIALTVSS